MKPTKFSGIKATDNSVAHSVAFCYTDTLVVEKAGVQVLSTFFQLLEQSDFTSPRKLCQWFATW
jgi:hypothetical protein